MPLTTPWATPSAPRPRGSLERCCRRGREVLAARRPSCEYVYEVAAGDEQEALAAGTAWADIPADWSPRLRSAREVEFVPCESERSVA